MIPAAEQTSDRSIPDREGKVAKKVGTTLLPPLSVSGKNNSPIAAQCQLWPQCTNQIGAVMETNVPSYAEMRR